MLSGPKLSNDTEKLFDFCFQISQRKSLSPLLSHLGKTEGILLFFLQLGVKHDFFESSFVEVKVPSPWVRFKW